MKRLTPRALIAVLCAVLLPLAAAAIGLWSLKDRVDNLAQVPAAVVNLDEGATMVVDGAEQTVPLGRMLAGALTQPGTVADPTGDGAPASDTGTDTGTDGGTVSETGLTWRLTDAEDAEAGLTDGSYAAVLTIPTDFSAKVTTIGTTEATPALITVESNDAASPFLGLVGDQVARAAAAAFGNRFTEQYLDGIYLGFNDLADQFAQAADGAEQLDDGATQLRDGLGRATSGTVTLADGADELASGADQVAGGVRTSADGAGDLAAGADQLAAGAAGADSGARALADGQQELATGAAGLGTGARSLDQGLRQYGAGVAALDQGIRGDGTPADPGLLGGTEALRAGVTGDGTPGNPGLVAGAQALAGGATQLADGIAAFDARFPDSAAEFAPLAAAATSVSEGAAGISGALNGPGPQGTPGLAPALTALADQCSLVVAPGPAGEQYCARLAATAAGLDATATGAGDLAVGAGQLAGGVAGTVDSPGLAGLVDGTNLFLRGDGTPANPGVLAGARALADGAQQSAAAAPELVQGVVALSDGARALADGSAQLAAGTAPLADGAGQLAAGADQVAAGSGALADGGRSLADGVGQLTDGTGELAAGSGALADGLGRLADGTDALADGTTELAGGADQLAEGGLALADGAGQLADGTGEMADGLREGAEQVPTYTEAERSAMAQQGAQPVVTEAGRVNGTADGATAAFPLVATLVLWLGAFGTFLVAPALRKRYLDAPLGAGAVTLRSLAPALAIGAIQALGVLALALALGARLESPATAALLVLLGALSFAAVQQALLALLGNRVGRLVSLLALVLQAASLGGLLPIATAPALFRTLNGVLPLAALNDGLTQAAMGGAVTSAGASAVTLVLWAGAALVGTVLAVGGARHRLLRGDAEEPRGSRHRAPVPA